MPVTVESVKATVFALSAFLIYPICIPGGAPRASMLPAHSRNVQARRWIQLIRVCRNLLIRRGPLSGWHNVAIEPNLLLVQSAPGAGADCEIELWMINF